MKFNALIVVCMYVHCTVPCVQGWNSWCEGLRGGHETEAAGNDD